MKIKPYIIYIVIYLANSTLFYSQSNINYFFNKKNSPPLFKSSEYICFCKATSEFDTMFVKTKQVYYNDIKYWNYNIYFKKNYSINLRNEEKKLYSYNSNSVNPIKEELLFDLENDTVGQIFPFHQSSLFGISKSLIEISNSFYKYNFDYIHSEFSYISNLIFNQNFNLKSFEFYSGYIYNCKSLRK